MVSFAEIQNAYNKLYTELRKYLWDFDTVACIADLEIAVYQTCQNLAEIRLRCARLKSQVLSVLYEDELLKNQFDYFEDLIRDDDVYVKLYQVNEVIQK